MQMSKTKKNNWLFRVYGGDEILPTAGQKCSSFHEYSGREVDNPANVGIIS